METGAHGLRDTGAREQFASGMVREPQGGRIMWSLVYDGPLLRRYAVHLTRGAEKYAPGNWLKASSEEEMNRFRDAAARHFAQWMAGEDDEDHAAAVVFNLNGYEYVRGRLRDG